MILNSPYISGSLTVTGNIISSGSITISGSIASASYASNAERVDGLDSTSFVFTSSYNTDSASVSTRVTKIEGNYATTGSNVFMGAQTVCANITSTGTIIAQTLNVQQVTSSIVYSSGSNIFGCLPSNVQQMTGSLRVTGSGNHWIVGGSVGINTTSPDPFGRGDALNVGISATGASDNMALSLNAGASGGRGSQIYMGQGGTRHFTLSSNITETTIGTVTNTPFRINTCDTTRLYVSSSTGNIGINTTTPTNGKLEIQQTCNAAALWVQTGGTTCCFTIADFRTGTNLSALQILGNGVSSFGGGVGIGTATPGITYSETLQVSATTPSRLNLTHTNTSNQRQSDVLFTENATLQFQVGTILGSGTFNDQNWIRGVTNIPLVLYTNDTERMRIDSCGRVGIGTTPSNWTTQGPVIQIGAQGSISAIQYSAANNQVAIANNAYVQQDTAFYYIASNPAAMMRIVNTGAYHWLRAASGTANAQITNFCRQMTLEDTGNLLIGTTTDNNYRLLVAGGSTLLCHTNLPLTVAFGGNSAFVFTNAGGAGTDNYTISHNLVYGSSGGYEIKHNADARWIRVIAGSNGVQLCGTGTAWYSLSDERRKFIHNTIDNGIDVVNKWKPIIYRFCTDVETVRRSGLTAQSILQTRPEAVSYDEHEDLYRVGYTELIPDLVSAIQQQTCIICQLKTCLGLT